MNFEEMANHTTFDERGNENIAITDISKALVIDYLNMVKSPLARDFEKMPFLEVLHQMDLLTGPKERRLIKNVAAMMFCKNLATFFPVTQVDIVIFPEGQIENPNNFIKRPKIIGPVPYMIEQTLNDIKTIIIRKHIIKQKDQAESITYFNYPYQAIKEAVINALYHRDYQEHKPIEITIEPKKISFLSYSGPDPSISLEEIKKAEKFNSHHYRNPRLGDFLKKLKLTEGCCMGIPTIQEELRWNGSAPARIKTNEERTFFLIEIPCQKRTFKIDKSPTREKNQANLNTNLKVK